MVLNFLRRLAPATAPCLLWAAVVTAHAQTPPGAAPRPDPLDPKAAVPALRYESSLTPPPRAGNDAGVGWRDANEAVARIGGWRAYAREAQQPDPARPSAPSVAPRAAPSAPPAQGGQAAQAGQAGQGGQAGRGAPAGGRQP